MAGWKEMLLDVLKLTDETKRLNHDIDRLQDLVIDIDKRVVRLETFVEVGELKRETELSEIPPETDDES